MRPRRSWSPHRAGSTSWSAMRSWPAMSPPWGPITVPAVLTGLELLRTIGCEPGKQPWIQMGVGIHAGPAYIGKVGTDGTNAVTALGDTVNTAARIQAQAGASELALSDELYSTIADRYPEAERRILTVRGKGEPLTIHVIRPSEG
ncbi:MAG: adenylate/guanylate cyclase domain-containing protein [Gemmatimonadetes bacterium]|nr:adenylate/guanylate cyclase domain-containing protein [Gemmatimonadota bacterium]